MATVVILTVLDTPIIAKLVNASISVVDCPSEFLDIIKITDLPCTSLSGDIDAGALRRLATA